jgi:UDP-N-acetylglucosamine 1-carboxyvinyltransferase
VLRNAASEPHVQDLARFLQALGAHVEGIGTNVLTIRGGKISRGAGSSRAGCTARRRR